MRWEGGHVCSYTSRVRRGGGGKGSAEVHVAALTSHPTKRQLPSPPAGEDSIQ